MDPLLFGFHILRCGIMVGKVCRHSCLFVISFKANIFDPNQRRLKPKRVKLFPIFIFIGCCTTTVPGVYPQSVPVFGLYFFKMCFVPSFLICTLLARVPFKVHTHVRARVWVWENNIYPTLLSPNTVIIWCVCVDHTMFSGLSFGMKYRIVRVLCRCHRRMLSKRKKSGTRLRCENAYAFWQLSADLCW